MSATCRDCEHWQRPANGMGICGLTKNSTRAAFGCYLGKGKRAQSGSAAGQETDTPSRWVTKEEWSE